MTNKKAQTKKETAGVAVLPPENTVEIKNNTDILLEKSLDLLGKILEACGEIKNSVDALARKFGGGY